MNACIITSSWDDGVREDLRLADLLDKYEIPATFYVPRASARRSLADRDVRALADRFEIGSHSGSHPRLRGLDDAAVALEIADGRRYVEDLLGREATAVAYPYGDYDDRVVRIARDCGITVGRTTESFHVHPPADWLRLATTVHAAPYRRDWTEDDLRAADDASLPDAVRALLDAAPGGAHYDWTRLALTCFGVALARGGIWHVWGHSWEVDEHALWQPLEDVFRAVARSSVLRATNGELAAVVAQQSGAAPARPVARATRVIW